MTPAELLARQREMEQAATPGPWYVESRDDWKPQGTWKVTRVRSSSVQVGTSFRLDKIVMRQEDWYVHPDGDDVAFIAAARNDRALLLDVAEAVNSILDDEARELPEDEWDPKFLVLRDALDALFAAWGAEQ